MISRADFAFTIGYEGSTAIVDAKARAAYGKLPVAELAEKGLYRAAFAAAVHSGSAEDMAVFMRVWNERAGTGHGSPEEFTRLFGVKLEEVRRVLAL